jgi:hypothetical protein
MKGSWNSQTLELISVISAFVALMFFMLGRWSAFRTMHQSVRGTKFGGKNIASPLNSLTSAFIDTVPKGSDSDFQKYANSIRHREKYKKSKLSD